MLFKRKKAIIDIRLWLYNKANILDLRVIKLLLILCCTCVYGVIYIFIDSIEYNIDNTSMHVEDATKQLGQALTYQVT